MNVPVGDLMEGGQGLAAVPGREVEFENALIQARDYAEILQPQSPNVLAGRPGSEHSFGKCREVFCSNLRKAYAVTRDLGIQLVTEPVNTIDLPGGDICTHGRPGYWLQRHSAIVVQNETCIRNDRFCHFLQTRH